MQSLPVISSFRNKMPQIRKMNLRLSVLVLLALITSCTQTAGNAGDEIDPSNEIDKTGLVKSSSMQDTLTIVDSEFTMDPFGLGENPLKGLTAIKGSFTHYQTIKNRHVDNQIDTSFQVKINEDTFEIYKSAFKSWLTAATINSDRFPVGPGMRIGMTKSELRDQLKLSENIPDFIRLQDVEGLEWLDFKFKEDKLFKIEFKGYMD